MKIGILGGTFNPIHQGHIRLARQYMQRLALDRVLIVPTKIPPHKQLMDLPDGEHRCEMIAIALQNEEGLQLSRIEQDLQGKSYSINTVQQLKRLNPQDEFFFIMGSDMFMSFHNWYMAEELMGLVTACTVPRNGDSLEALHNQAKNIIALGGSAVVEDAPPMDISSTDVRSAIAAGERDCEKIGLAKEVLEYILQNSLYGTCAEDYAWDYELFEEEARLLEKPKRFEHSQNVAARAGELAKIYGLPPNACYVAGLLHDICKDMPEDELLQWLLKSDIIKDKIIFEVPSTWHGPAAAVYIKERLCVHNRSIISAVGCHTTGKAGMSLFDKVLYMADLTSSERNYPLADELRVRADVDMEGAVLEALEFIVQKREREGFPMTADTMGVCHEYGLLPSENKI